MYITFEDAAISFLKAAFVTALAVIQLLLTLQFYKLGCSYCDFMNIPYDFALTVMSPGFAIEVAIVLSVIEISVVIWLFNKLKRFKLIKLMSDSISSIF